MQSWLILNKYTNLWLHILIWHYQSAFCFESPALHCVVHTYVHIPATVYYIRTYMRMYIHAYTRTYVCIYIHTYLHAYCVHIIWLVLPLQEERKHNSTLRGELATLEGVLEKSGDQTREELRTLKQMFEQSEQSRNTSKLISPYSWYCLKYSTYTYVRIYVVLSPFQYSYVSGKVPFVQCQFLPTYMYMLYIRSRQWS